MESNRLHSTATPVRAPVVCHCGRDYVRMGWGFALECPYPDLLDAIITAWAASPDAQFVAVCQCGCVQPYGYVGGP